MVSPFFQLDEVSSAVLLRLTSPDGMNRLTRGCVRSLISAIEELERYSKPLILAGNPRFFSVGAELNEIANLTGPEARQFSPVRQTLMNAIASFPAPVIAAVEGHCMGGGLDLALACHRRIAGPHAMFGHRGAALGLITGWGGTQRLPRLIGKGRALALFVAAEKVPAATALEIGLVDALSDGPADEARRWIGTRKAEIAVTEQGTSSEMHTSTPD